ncbi:MAG: imidazolonepropionase [Myxococcota bacterium]|jgi:imidazolonepropionase
MAKRGNRTGHVRMAFGYHEGRRPATIALAMNTLLLVNIGRLVSLKPGDLARPDAQLLIRDGRVIWAGDRSEEPPVTTDEVVGKLDCGGRVVLPGLIDCHTHLVFGGDRAGEFAKRSSGISYETIAAEGGGIQSTVSATRATDEDELVRRGRGRLDRMLGHGVTCVEIKSGYGLDVETELKMLRVIERLNQSHPITLVATFLGAHSTPPEWSGNPAGYIDHVVTEMLPAVAKQGVAEFCDVFCEQNVFSVEQSRQVLEAGRHHGLIPKVHAEQLHRIGGTQLGVELGAASVDHLEAITDKDIELLAGSETVAVLLPGATLFLGMNEWPPARALLDAGVTVALSTDCNPGSSMCEDLRLMTTLGCTRMGMSPTETLRGVTWAGAVALRRQAERGHFGIGTVGDCVVFDTDNEVDLPYRFGQVAAWAVIVEGEIVRGPGSHANGLLGEV